MNSLELWLMVALGLVLLGKGIQYGLQVRRARRSASEGPILIENWYDVEPPMRSDAESERGVPDFGFGPRDPSTRATASPRDLPGAPASGAPSAPSLDVGPPGGGNASRQGRPAAARPESRNAPPSQLPPRASLPERPEPQVAPAPQLAPRSSPPVRPQERPEAHDEDSETVQIDLGSSGVVQLLPGRLEVVRGGEVGREFRFLRAPGQKVPEITIGRSAGSPTRHIQIPQATVSRLHARLRFEDGTWQLTNLSTTNPTRVNGEELESTEESVPLSDGDRIELGEVEVRFRETGS